MRILVIGGGVTGSHLAEKFCADGHDVVVVDEDADALASLEAHLDLLTVRGNGADPEVLEEAGIGRADLLLAVTDSDDTNILACIFAKTRGVDRTAARVSAAGYMTSRHIDFAKLGVDLLVNQHDEYARDVCSVLRLPGAIEVTDLLDGRIMVVGMSIHMDSPLLGNTLSGFGNPDWIRRIRFLAVSRGDEILAPHGDTSFLVGDDVYFAGEPDAISAFLQWAWPENKRFQRVVVAGGGELGLQLARRLEEARMPTVLVEKDSRRADYCSEQLRRTLVIKGDALERQTLAGIGDAEGMAYVAATGSDELNIIGCLVAERFGVRFTAAKISKPEYIEIASQLRLLDRVVDPNLAMVNAILHFVRGRNVSAVALFSRLPGELIELKLDDEHPWAGRAIRDLPKLPADVILLAALRSGQVRVATGDLRLEAGDRVVLYCQPDTVDKLDRLLGHD
ncbi:MAG: Trk system potassium transporter TrkA [Kiritimatiellae bacterium]|nr:Trk system potassium transporter TrkA [Kiritimatiellia bacterium]